MKKQILFLFVFTLAIIFAGTKTYGQVTYTNNLTGAPVNATAVALTCAADNELQPIPGKVYTNGVTVPAGSTVKWFVTDVNTVIDGAGAAPALASASDIGDGTGNYVLTSDGAYNKADNTTATTKISWKSFDGATNEVLLVAYVEDATACTNNIIVYRIIPSFNFTLDLVALLDDGKQGSTECISNVESAAYTPGTPGNLTMNYGENWVFFSVTAANFVHSWMPTITTSYAGGASTVPASDIQWAYSADAQSTDAADWHAVTDPVEAQAVAGGAVGPTGESIVVRVRIDHGNVEAAGTLTFGINGVMYDPATKGYANTALTDLDAPTAPATTCDNTKTDTQTYVLSPRPTITSNTGSPVLNFVPKN